MLSGRRARDDAEGSARALASARAALSEAGRLAPDFAEVDALLGYTYLLDGEDAARGLPHLERARRRLPDRMDIVVHQTQLYMKLGRFEEAEALIETTLATYADEELLAASREELIRRRLLHQANAALREGDHDLGLRLLDEAISVTSDDDLRARLEAQLDELQRRVEGR